MDSTIFFVFFFGCLVVFFLSPLWYRYRCQPNIASRLMTWPNFSLGITIRCGRMNRNPKRNHEGKWRKHHLRKKTKNEPVVLQNNLRKQQLYVYIYVYLYTNLRTSKSAPPPPSCFYMPSKGFPAFVGFSQVQCCHWTNLSKPKQV